jgi:hypothetical protein
VQRHLRLCSFHIGARKTRKNCHEAIAASLLALSLAACATNPPPPVYPDPPPKKQADAKTQLESGRKY